MVRQQSRCHDVQIAEPLDLVLKAHRSRLIERQAPGPEADRVIPFQRSSAEAPQDATAADDGRWLLDTKRLPWEPTMPLPKGFHTGVLLQELDKTRELCGARVVYFDGATMSVLREGPPISQADLLAVVVRRGSKDLLPSSAEIAQARDERFHSELMNLGLSCGGALLAWVATISSAGAAPVTGGTSLIITKAAAVASAVGYAQCVVAIARTSADLYAPQMTVDLDNTRWYPIVSDILDGIGLAGAAISASGMIKSILVLRKTTGKTMLNVLKGLSRQERKRLTEELLRSTNPGLSRGKIKELTNLGVKTFPKRYSTSAINAGIRAQLLDAIGAAGNLGGSATGGLINQAVSVDAGADQYLIGVVNAYEVE